VIANQSRASSAQTREEDVKLPHLSLFLVKKTQQMKMQIKFNSLKQQPKIMQVHIRNQF
jgi:hypothetical protein